ncbi:hypothetical protein [Streptomyces fuscichromogenes]|uniref:Uncharacterized protein n=1 Tax=Streptomyces fuscichromogenes TaxID=1324013 RepID=A0A918CXU9_9ACTN|nr:hypothetical protein [Streptomyces fuscichromogenes]GGN46334.1 hypothetical protein GCM10011578_099150 [Streptomyces fuscichromogenes]
MLDSTDYIEPADRPAAWATMAHEYAARDWPRPEIASALCVDEPTVDRLLAMGASAAGDTTRPTLAPAATERCMDIVL